MFVRLMELGQQAADRRQAAVAHSPAAPQSRPRPRNPLYTFLYNWVLSPSRNIILSNHLSLALRVAFCNPV